MDLAHLSTNPLYDLYGLSFTQFTIPPSTSSVWIHIALPPSFMTDSSGSLPSSPNTKPWAPVCTNVVGYTKSGLPGPSCASVLLPMPDSRQRLCKIRREIMKISIELHIKDISMPSTAFFSYFRSWLTHHVNVVSKWNEKNKLKFHLRSAWWTWHISAPILCIWPPFHSVHHCTFDLLCLDPYCSTSPHYDWFLIIAHHPHPNTKPEAPVSPMLLWCKSQVCQGRVVLQSFCQCLTGDKYLQNTWWNHLILEIHIQDISMPSTAFFSYLLWWLTYHVVSSEMKRTSSNSLRSASWTWHICFTNPLHILRLSALSGSIFTFD